MDFNFRARRHLWHLTSSPQLQVLHELLHRHLIQQHEVRLPKLQPLQLRHPRLSSSNTPEQTNTHREGRLRERPRQRLPGSRKRSEFPFWVPVEHVAVGVAPDFLNAARLRPAGWNTSLCQAAAQRELQSVYKRPQLLHPPPARFLPNLLSNIHKLKPTSFIQRNQRLHPANTTYIYLLNKCTLRSIFTFYHKVSLLLLV